MNSLLILIPISIIFLGIAIWTFFWAVKKNQFEDLERHGHMVLWEKENFHTSKKSDDMPSSSPNNKTIDNKKL
ncbi:MAG: cbb3-type cytochrome oxidase assembly protein CcoS [Pseudomonadota bacterium]